MFGFCAEKCSDIRKDFVSCGIFCSVESFCTSIKDTLLANVISLAVNAAGIASGNVADIFSALSKILTLVEQLAHPPCVFHDGYKDPYKVAKKKKAEKLANDTEKFKDDIGLNWFTLEGLSWFEQEVESAMNKAEGLKTSQKKHTTTSKITMGKEDENIDFRKTDFTKSKAPDKNFLESIKKP